MQLSRRQCLTWGSAAIATSWLGACASPQRQAALSQGIGFAHLQLGAARITAVSDGVGRRPLEAGFVKNATLAQVQASLQAQGLPSNHIDVPYTCFVVELDGKRYLLDTGFGDNGPAGTGQLHANMRAAGIAPDSIDRIIISHLHGDHINGLRRKDGSLIYPKAVVMVPQPELSFWMDDARMQAAPEAARGGFATARRVFANYPSALLKQFVPGSSLAPGIGTLATFGHTPGHTAVRVSSGQQRFTFIGDVTNVPALFVTNPDWQVQFDMNAEQARTTRRALLNQLAKDGDWVGGYHFPLPAFGHIHTAGNGFAWKVPG